MGRERIAKRLADLAFKMAANNLCSAESVFDHHERPVHVAFLDKKLPCPHSFCKDKSCFYKEDGIDHHFRTVHRKTITNEELREAQKNMKILHGDETLRCLKTFSNIRARQVIIIPFANSCPFFLIYRRSKSK